MVNCYTIAIATTGAIGAIAIFGEIASAIGTIAGTIAISGACTGLFKYEFKSQSANKLV